jgi:hypothetical protein
MKKRRQPEHITPAMIDEILSQKSIDPSTVRLPLESFERLAEKMTFLGEAAKILNTSLDSEIERPLAHLVHLIIPTLADWCLIYLKNKDGTVTAVNISHIDPRKEKVLRDSAEIKHPSMSQDIGVPWRHTAWEVG